MNLAAYIKNTTKIIVGVGLAQGIVVLSLPIISRYYSPESFSVYSNFLYYVGIISTIFIFRFDNILISIPFSAKRSFILKYLINVYLFITVLVGIISAYQIAHGKEAKIALILTGAASTSVFQLILGLHISNRAYTRITKLRIMQASVMSLAQLSLSGISGLGLIFGEILSRLCSFISAPKGTKCRLPWYVLWHGRTFLRKSKPHIHAGLYSTLATLVSTASLLSPVLFFTEFSIDAKAAGFFMIAYKIASVPVTLVSRSMAQVFLGDVGRMNANQQAFSHVLRINTFIAAIVGLLLWAASLILDFALGPKWSGASNYVLCLIPLVIGQIILLPLVQIYIIKNKNLELLKWEIGRFAIVHTALVAVIVSGISSSIIIVFMYSSMMLLSYLILLIRLKSIL
jgi:O-antigen/teichoic acid export membrane protein